MKSDLMFSHFGMTETVVMEGARSGIKHNSGLLFKAMLQKACQNRDSFFYFESLGNC